MALSLSRKVLILVTVPVVFELFLVGASLAVISKIETARSREAHARELAEHWNSAMAIHMRRMSLLVASRATVAHPFAQEIARLAAKLKAEFAQVSRLASQSPQESKDWHDILDTAAQIDARFTQAAELYANDDKVKAAVAWMATQNQVERMFSLGEKLVAEQVRLQQESADQQAKYDLLLQVLLCLSVLGSVLIAFGLAYFFNRGTTSRLRILMANANQLAAGQAPQTILTGSDELAKLNAVYHRMYKDMLILRAKERAILDNAADVIASIDGDLRFSDVNNAIEKWGFHTEDMLGRRVTDLLKDTVRADVAERLTSVALERTEMRFESTLIDSQGQEHDTSWSVSWSAEERSLYCVISDISERKQLERMKQEFVAMLSHDLRTPLTSVLTSLELLAHPHFELNEEGQDYLTKAERSLKLCISLINELLELERYEAGMMQLEMVQADLRQLVAAAIDSVDSLARSKQISITLAPPKRGHERLVNLDIERISRVLINLLGNAIKFSPVGGSVLIELEFERAAVRVKVIDRGRGIPSNLCESIFDRYKQVQISDSRSGAGSGLGLAICKVIVEAHKGQIGVISEDGKGSVFWFDLPI